MISRRPERLGTSTLMVLSKRPGRKQGRVEVGGPVGGADHQEVGGFDHPLTQGRARRQPPVGHVDDRIDGSRPETAGRRKTAAV